MSGQGSVTTQIAIENKNAGWNVVYKCIPNTPHINVVPIPIINGSATQRYPDILAYRGKHTKLVEVEIRLNETVAKDIGTRFNEMVAALSDSRTWETWREHILRSTSHTLPTNFFPKCELILCRPISQKANKLVQHLGRNGIFVATPETYTPSNHDTIE